MTRRPGAELSTCGAGPGSGRHPHDDDDDDGDDDDAGIRVGICSALFHWNRTQFQSIIIDAPNIGGIRLKLCYYLYSRFKCVDY
jgi:hypothetical protein